MRILIFGVTGLQSKERIALRVDDSWESLDINDSVLGSDIKVNTCHEGGHEDMYCTIRLQPGQL
jgi:hypothetical protein